MRHGGIFAGDQRGSDLSMVQRVATEVISSDRVPLFNEQFSDDSRETRSDNMMQSLEYS